MWTLVLQQSTCTCVCVGLSHLEQRCDPCPYSPYVQDTCPEACVCVCVFVEGVMIVPWCSVGLSSADNQVGSPPPFYSPNSSNQSLPSCVLFPWRLIDVWLTPGIQLCKINTRIKHQTTGLLNLLRPHHSPSLSISLLYYFSFIVFLLSVVFIKSVLSISFRRSCPHLDCFSTVNYIVCSQLLVAQSQDPFIFTGDRQMDGCLLYLSRG